MPKFNAPDGRAGIATASGSVPHLVQRDHSKPTLLGRNRPLLVKCQLEENAPGRLHRFADVEPGARPSSLARDEVLADYLRDVFVECDGELVLLDAFDLTIAEHRMMHGVANGE